MCTNCKKKRGICFFDTCNYKFLLKLSKIGCRIMIAENSIKQRKCKGETKVTEQIRVLIGDDTAGNGVRIASKLREMGIFAYTRRKNGKVVLNGIVKDNPDVVVVDLTLPELDALAVMKKTEKLLDKKPAFIIISDVRNSFIERQVMDNGASYFLVRPYEVENLCSVIKSVARRTVKPDCMDLEILATDIIHKLGVPAHIKGYHYLRAAILNAVENRRLMESVTKQLYPCVAKQYDTTSSRVERAIRHAIEITWDRGRTETLNSFFGYTADSYRGRPTNSEFIALITDKLRLQIKAASMLDK